eukprot:1856664-Prymnesium_polylepis.1
MQAALAEGMAAAEREPGCVLLVVEADRALPVGQFTTPLAIRTRRTISLIISNLLIVKSL